MKFLSIQQAINKKTGKVAIRGWIYRERGSNKFKFIVLRDSTNIIQVVLKKEKFLKQWKDIDSLLIESAVEIEGTIKADKRAPTGYEIQATKINIISKADKFPITKHKSEEFLLDIRHLWLRSRKLTAVMKVRSKVFQAIHEFFHKKEFFEAHSPILLPGVAESGPDLFEVNFFNKKVYLTQTWQLYAETMLPSLEKIYTITPAFRAEKSKTARHLAEYWTAEAEAAWLNLNDCIKLSEELISYICQKVAKDCKPELKILERDPKYLANIKPPFPKITYTKALEILKKDKIKIKWGKDLRTLEEKKLAQHYKKPLIVTNYPKEAMAFYKPRDKKNPKTAICYDIISPEIGIELVGGSERDLDVKELENSLKAVKEDPKKYKFYFDTRKYGAIPHAGFGLGIERIITWICKLNHIRDAIAFPRTITRYKP